MTKFTKSFWVFLFVWAAMPSPARATLTLMTSREQTNSQDLVPNLSTDTSTSKIRFNQLDCKDNIPVVFAFTETAAITGNLYLVAGDGCTAVAKGPDVCLFVEITTATKVTKNLRDLLEQKNIVTSEDCAGTGTIDVWVARLPDPNDRVATTPEDWSPAETLEWDMDPPNSPKGLSSGPGDKKVVVKWQGESTADAGTVTDGLDDEVTTVQVIYTDGSDAAAASASLDAGPGDTDSAAVAENTGTDTGSFSDCPTNGFKKGDAYVHDQYGEETNTNPAGGSHEVSGLTNGRMYKFGAVALDDYNNPSAISETVCDMPGETKSFFDDYKDAGGKGGKFCFVATAAFGSYDHPVVQVLRRFRDNFLAPMPGGRAMIDTYYRVGPSMASVVENHPALRSAAKGALFVFALFTIPLSSLGPLYTLLLCTAMFGLFWVRRKSQ